MARRTRVLISLAALLLAGAVWLPCVHLLFAREPDAHALLRQQLRLLDDAELRARAVAPMRAANPEWDLMGRSFVAWSLANWALREPAHTDEALARIDRQLDETLRVEREQGIYAFLLPYARARDGDALSYSLFVDSEIALTVALRRLVRDDQPELRALGRERIARIADRLQRAPLHLVESYPEEGWTFDHAVALAAIKVSDKLDATDHRELAQAWVASARAHLRDPRSGLLVSSFTPEGRVLDGPEGSTLWMTLHCLQLVDEPFAREQYAIARRELGASLLGFGWAREWPASWRGARDIDSGPVVPIFDVSAGSSGLAFVAAASFGDRAYLRQLETTLGFAAFPIGDEHGKRYAASNQVGDAVLLYALELGPAWQRAR